MEHGHRKVVAGYLGISQGKKQFKKEAVISMNCKENLDFFNVKQSIFVFTSIRYITPISLDQ